MKRISTKKIRMLHGTDVSNRRREAGGRAAFRLDEKPHDLRQPARKTNHRAGCLCFARKL